MKTVMTMRLLNWDMSLTRLLRRGFVTEAVNAVINELHEMGFKKVVAGFFERNISAMSVKWSSKDLANPRALSVIYDGKTITSS